MIDARSRKSWDQRLLTVLWVWVSFRTLLPWLVFFRLTFEGDSYSWGTTYFGKMFHSSGLARIDFLLVYALLAAGIFLLYHLRRFNFRLAAPLLVFYLGIFAADALYELVAGEPVIVRGDTLDVTINVSIPFFILNFGMFLVGAVWWAGVRDVAVVARPTSMVNYKRFLVKVCIAIVPVQLILLIFGEPHGLTDEIGVVMTLLQGATVAFAFYPGSAYRAQEARPNTPVS